MMTELEKKLYALETADLNHALKETLVNSIGKARAKQAEKSFNNMDYNVKIGLILEHNPNYVFTKNGWEEK